MPPVEYSKYSKIELSVLAISDIIQELLKAHENGKDLNLNKTKTQISAKYGLPSTPKVCQQVLNLFFIIKLILLQLVDIIAAVPIEYRKILVPKLKAKPIRTASGVQDICCAHYSEFIF